MFFKSQDSISISFSLFTTFIFIYDNFQEEKTHSEDTHGLYEQHKIGDNETRS